jgi:hypothetical protein
MGRRSFAFWFFELLLIAIKTTWAGDVGRGRNWSDWITL